MEYQLSEWQKSVLRGKICPYCGQASVFFKSSAQFYGGRDFGPVFACLACEAWVGCHDGTETPLGRLADKELRAWKVKAHDAFDTLWRQNRSVKRHEAYAMLSKVLDIPPEYCHIGMFSSETCEKVVKVRHVLDAMVEEEMNRRNRPRK